MSLLVNLYDSRSLTRGINKVSVTEPFVLSKIFGTKENHDADKIDIEIEEGSGKIAQFVGQDEPNPRPTKNTTTKTQTVTIPRTFESKIFTPKMLREFGAIGGIYATAEERQAAQGLKVAKELADLKDRVMRRREKMAVDGLVTGAITVSQDNIAFSVDFGFVNTTHLLTLTGADLWSATTTAQPLVKMKEWKKLIQQRSFRNATHLLLGANASAYFLQNDAVLKALDTNNYKVGSIDVTQDGTVAAIYIGKLLGVEVWEYVQQYTDESTGLVTDMFDADRAVMVAAGDSNRLHLGPIERIGENGATQLFNGEFYLEVDSKSNNTMLQWNCEQKSLPAIHDPGAVISAKVV